MRCFECWNLIVVPDMRPGDGVSGKAQTSVQTAVCSTCGSQFTITITQVGGRRQRKERRQTEEQVENSRLYGGGE